MDLFIPLDRASARPLRDQLYTGLRAAIIDGRLPFGVRLPASRALAKSLAVSRFTIDDAYSRLVSDGYVTGRHGSGTFVAYGEPVAPQTVNSPAVTAVATTPAERPWSQWALRLPLAR